MLTILLKRSVALNRHLINSKLRQNVHFNITESHTNLVFRTLATQSNTERKRSAAFKTQKDSVVKDFNYYFNRLQSDVTNECRVSADLLKMVLSSIKSDQIISSDAAELIIRCCGNLIPDKTKEFRVQLLDDVWKQLYQQNKNFAQKEHIQALLCAFQENGKSFNDFNAFLSKTTDIDKNSREFLEDILFLSCSRGDLTEALKIMTQMKELQIALTVNVFNHLILGHSRSGAVKDCESVIETMRAANLEPNKETYAQLCLAYIENKTSTNKALQILSAHGSYFNETQLFQLIRAAARSDDKSLVTAAVKHLPLDVLKQTQIHPSLRNICTELVYDGEFDKAFTLIDALPTPQFQPHEDTDTHAAFLVKDLVKSNADPSEVVSMCKKLIETKRNERSLFIACEIALRTESSDSMYYLKSLAETEKLRPHYFWPLILSKFEESGENGILSVVKEMNHLSVELDYDSLTFHVLPKLSMTLKDPMLAVKMLEDHGVKMTNLMAPLTSHLICQQRYLDAIKIVNTFKTKVDTELMLMPLVMACGTLRRSRKFPQIAKLIKFLTERSQNSKYDLAGQLMMELVSNYRYKDDARTISQLLNELFLIGAHISPIASDILTQYFAASQDELARSSGCETLKKLVDTKLHIPQAEFFGAHIAHPRDMTLAELECHLVELQSKNLNARGVLRRILQLCVREGKLERALEVKQMCDDLKVNLSPGMLASTFDLMIRTKNLKAAKGVLDQISKDYPGFLLDEHKIVDYASLMIENNQLSEAKIMLKMYAGSCRIRGGQNLLKNVWQLLTIVANNSQDPKTCQTKEVLNFLIKLGFCTAHNTLLGPVIREYINKNDLIGATTEFQNLADKYKKTPLQVELLTTLVEASNSVDNKFNLSPLEAKNLLQKVVEAAGKVHGANNVNIALVVAFADAGTESQLRKLLIDPNIQLNPDILTKQCEHLSNNGKIDPIIRLAKCSRGLNHVIREQELYNLMLNHLIRDNKYELALSMFDKLHSDDELRLSNEFARNLSDLLVKNNLEVPTAVRLHAK